MYLTHLIVIECNYLIYLNTLFARRRMSFVSFVFIWCLCSHFIVADNKLLDMSTSNWTSHKGNNRPTASKSAGLHIKLHGRSTIRHCLSYRWRPWMWAWMLPVQEINKAIICETESQKSNLCLIICFLSCLCHCVLTRRPSCWVPRANTGLLPEQSLQHVQWNRLQENFNWSQQSQCSLSIHATTGRQFEPLVNLLPPLNPKPTHIHTYTYRFTDTPAEFVKLVTRWQWTCVTL